jgi:hypothetical protein
LQLIETFSPGLPFWQGCLLPKSSFDNILTEIAKMEQEGKLLPCQMSPQETNSLCFHKCPLLMDLFLQADKLRLDSAL